MRELKTPRPIELDRDLLDHFASALQEAGIELEADRKYEVEYEALDGTQRLDAVVRLKNDPSTVLAIECKRQAFPRDIRNALWLLDEYARDAASSGDTVVRVLLAERISPGARNALRHRGVAFYDESGTLFFRHGPITIDIDREPQPERRPQPGSPFIGSREQVVHALLHMGERWFTGHELAEQAKTSPYTVSQTLQVLQQHGWVEGKSAGRNAQRRLVGAGQLLDAWAESWKSRQDVASTWFTFASKPSLLPTQVAWLLRDSPIQWAYSGTSAGNALVVLLTNVDRLQIIVPPHSTAEVAAAAKLNPAEQGSNVTIVERSGASLMFQRTLPEFEVPLASPFIIYLDLLKDERGRNKELAHELRQRVLKI